MQAPAEDSCCGTKLRFFAALLFVCGSGWSAYLSLQPFKKVASGDICHTDRYGAMDCGAASAWMDATVPVFVALALFGMAVIFAWDPARRALQRYGVFGNDLRAPLMDQRRDDNALQIEMPPLVGAIAENPPIEHRP